MLSLLSGGQLIAALGHVSSLFWHPAWESGVPMQREAEMRDTVWYLRPWTHQTPRLMACPCSVVYTRANKSPFLLKLWLGHLSFANKGLRTENKHLIKRHKITKGRVVFWLRNVYGRWVSSNCSVVKWGSLYVSNRHPPDFTLKWIDRKGKVTTVSENKS